MKPIQVQLLYDSKTYKKAMDIFHLVENFYKLSHVYNYTITTPMFCLSLHYYRLRPYTEPDIIIVPKDKEKFIEIQDNIKIIQYDKDEVIQLWEQ